MSSLPLQWDPRTNVQWKVPIPGKGWSSPIVHDGRIFLTTAVPSREQPPNQQSLRVLCIAAANGETLWDVEAFVKEMDPGETLNPKNSFASPTPITDGNCVCAFRPGQTACLDREGKRIWANDQVRYNPQHGAGGSPVFSGERLIFHCDGAEDPFVVDCIVIRGLCRGNASSPHGLAEMVLRNAPGNRGEWHAATHLPGSSDGLQLRSRFRKELWRFRYPNKWSIVPRPVFAHGLVYVCTGYDGPAELLAIRPTGSGT